MFINLPFIWRILLITLLIGSGLTIFWGSVHVKDDHAALKKQFLDDMNVRARTSRIRLDNYVKLHHYSAELFVTQKRFLTYLEKTQPLNKDDGILVHKKTPSWFPDRSVQRSFIKSHNFLLLDSAGEVRESYSRRGREVPPELHLRIKQQNTLLLPTESWFIKLQNSLYLITSQSLEKGGVKAWSRLLLATEVDDEFLHNSQGLLETIDLFALINNDTQSVMVSSDLDTIPLGVSIEALKEEYLVGSEAFFDYGNSDVIIKMVLLIPRNDLQKLLDKIDNKSMKQVVLISTTFVISFILLFYWFINNLDMFTSKMVSFSKNKLGIDAPTAAPGGPIERVQNQFKLLSEAILQAREREKLTQVQLAKSEMMAALGDLVAGVAHEINTPLGTGYTSSSFLNGQTKTLKTAFENQKLTRSDLEAYLDMATESTMLIEKNLSRASDLIRSFKMVAVDQGRNDQREFDMKSYVEEVLVNLRPKWKRTNHKVKLNCLEDFSVNSYPGAISQIITNLIVNSLDHGFKEQKDGCINIDISRQKHQEEMIFLRYWDNGCGMSQEGVNKVFEPFFTTARDQGGSGLGMHIVYNLVNQALNGTIECQSKPGEGVVFEILFPAKIPKREIEQIN
ncbi:MAG: HAMP domain-containing histidine kinase [Magnetococcales bacterium]|nr:HAMP domain-containing histidine kinase [Magnetococcales bacterium]